MAYGDTPKHDHDLCKTCANAFFIEGRSLNEGFKGCNELPKEKWVQYPVTACSMYCDKTKQSKHEMEKIATIIEVNKRGEFIGFRPPDRRERKPWED